MTISSPNIAVSYMPKSLEQQFPGIPLFDSAEYFINQPKHALFPAQSPEVETFVRGLDVPEALEDFRYSKDFLLSYSRKSRDTYDKFRGDAERLLLWSWLVAKKSVVQLRRRDLEEFIEFVATPPAHWQAANCNKRFLQDGAQRRVNPRWRPFRDAGTASGRLNTKSWQGLFSNLSIYYNYLMAEDYAFGNQVPIVKKNCPYITQSSALKTARRLSALQWDYLITYATQLADKQPEFERTLFVVATMKSLKLRISELSVRRQWAPVMSHFHRDHEGNWWFRAYGKGGKLRDISISDEYLVYLKRYRRHRGLVPTLPAQDDHSAIIPALDSNKGIGSRQLRNLVQAAFDGACEQLKSDGFHEDAAELHAATTHWLRHTGASMEVAAGRELSHVQADLGHGSIRTTDEFYVDSDNRERAHSAKRQHV